MPNIKVLDVVSAIHKRVREQTESLETPAVSEDWSNDLQDSERAAPDHPRITKHGVTDRIAGVRSRCDILICPEFVGGGVSAKFAEAVYNRMPVLARTCAACGVALGEAPEMLLLDEPREWVEFLLSPMARAFGGGRVSERVAKTFAIETHKDALQKFVSNCATSAHSGRSQAGLGRWTRH